MFHLEIQQLLEVVDYLDKQISQSNRSLNLNKHLNKFRNQNKLFQEDYLVELHQQQQNLLSNRQKNLQFHHYLEVVIKEDFSTNKKRLNLLNPHKQIGRAHV